MIPEFRTSKRKSESSKNRIDPVERNNVSSFIRIFSSQRNGVCTTIQKDYRPKPHNQIQLHLFIRQQYRPKALKVKKTFMLIIMTSRLKLQQFTRTCNFIHKSLRTTQLTISSPQDSKLTQTKVPTSQKSPQQRKPYTHRALLSPKVHLGSSCAQLQVQLRCAPTTKPQSQQNEDLTTKFRKINSGLTLILYNEMYNRRVNMPSIYTMIHTLLASKNNGQ